MTLTSEERLSWVLAQAVASRMLSKAPVEIVAPRFPIPLHSFYRRKKRRKNDHKI